MKKNKKTVEYPIDFVMPWVDGNDPEWRKEKAIYSGIPDDGDQREVRYRDWDILQYWFRGVETFAPWVNKVHFITWGHVPEWLDTSNPKINIVKHTDYIPEKYLPTFNSHTIELNMHRIPGLAEHFVYFNDDVFITAPVKPDDFFKKGLPCDTFAMNAIYFGKDSVGPINGNNVTVINTHFPKKPAFKKNWKKYFSPVNGWKKLIHTFLLMPWPWFPGFWYSHTSNSYLKSTFETVWEKEGELLDKTCMDKFRQQTNVNQWLFKTWQFASGNFVPVSSKSKYCYHVKESIASACNSVRTSKFKIVCINDTGKTTDFESKAEELRNAFQELLANKSKFES